MSGSSKNIHANPVESDPKKNTGWKQKLQQLQLFAKGLNADGTPKLGYYEKKLKEQELKEAEEARKQGTEASSESHVVGSEALVQRERDTPSALLNNVVVKRKKKKKKKKEEQGKQKKLSKLSTPTKEADPESGYKSSSEKGTPPMARDSLSSTPTTLNSTPSVTPSQTSPQSQRDVCKPEPQHQQAFMDTSHIPQGDIEDIQKICRGEVPDSFTGSEFLPVHAVNALIGYIRKYDTLVFVKDAFGRSLAALAAQHGQWHLVHAFPVLPTDIQVSEAGYREAILFLATAKAPEDIVDFPLKVDAFEEARENAYQHLADCVAQVVPNVYALEVTLDMVHKYPDVFGTGNAYHKSLEGYPLFHLAVAYEQVSFAKHLLNTGYRGGEFNRDFLAHQMSASQEYMTPIYVAAGCPNLAMFDLLLEYDQCQLIQQVIIRGKKIVPLDRLQLARLSDEDFVSLCRTVRRFIDQDKSIISRAGIDKFFREALRVRVARRLDGIDHKNLPEDLIALLHIMELNCFTAFLQRSASVVAGELDAIAFDALLANVLATKNERFFRALEKADSSIVYVAKRDGLLQPIQLAYYLTEHGLDPALFKALSNNLRTNAGRIAALQVDDPDAKKSEEKTVYGVLYAAKRFGALSEEQKAENYQAFNTVMEALLGHHKVLKEMDADQAKSLVQALFEIAVQQQGDAKLLRQALPNLSAVQRLKNKGLIDLTAHVDTFSSHESSHETLAYITRYANFEATHTAEGPYKGMTLFHALSELAKLRPGLVMAAIQNFFARRDPSILTYACDPESDINDKTVFDAFVAYCQTISDEYQKDELAATVKKAFSQERMSTYLDALDSDAARLDAMKKVIVVLQHFEQRSGEPREVMLPEVESHQEVVCRDRYASILLNTYLRPLLSEGRMWNVLADIERIAFDEWYKFWEIYSGQEDSDADCCYKLIEQMSTILNSEDLPASSEGWYRKVWVLYTKVSAVSGQESSRDKLVKGFDRLLRRNVSPRVLEKLGSFQQRFDEMRDKLNGLKVDRSAVSIDDELKASFDQLQKDYKAFVDAYPADVVPLEIKDSRNACMVRFQDLQRDVLSNHLSVLKQAVDDVNASQEKVFKDYHKLMSYFRDYVGKYPYADGDHNDQALKSMQGIVVEAQACLAQYSHGAFRSLLDIHLKSAESLLARGDAKDTFNKLYQACHKVSEQGFWSRINAVAAQSSSQQRREASGVSSPATFKNEVDKLHQRIEDIKTYVPLVNHILRKGSKLNGLISQGNERALQAKWTLLVALSREGEFYPESRFTGALCANEKLFSNHPAEMGKNAGPAYFTTDKQLQQACKQLQACVKDCIDLHESDAYNRLLFVKRALDQALFVGKVSRFGGGVAYELPGGRKKKIARGIQDILNEFAVDVLPTDPGSGIISFDVRLARIQSIVRQRMLLNEDNSLRSGLWARIVRGWRRMRRAKVVQDFYDQILSMSELPLISDFANHAHGVKETETPLSLYNRAAGQARLSQPQLTSEEQGEAVITPVSSRPRLKLTLEEETAAAIGAVADGIGSFAWPEAGRKIPEVMYEGSSESPSEEGSIRETGLGVAGQVRGNGAWLFRGNQSRTENSTSDEARSDFVPVDSVSALET